MGDRTISTARDVVDYLTEQHERIKELFIETLDAADAATQESVFAQLRRLLAVHETAEEMMIHPRVRRKVEGGDAIIDARLAEEHAAKQALQEIEKLQYGTSEFAKAVIHLQADVLQHAQREEDEEFSALDSELSDDERKKLTSAVQLAERIAPTHPHAGVESGAANFAVGPFVSLLDRARDALSDAFG
jgi:hemerythrin superfamily protein